MGSSIIIEPIVSPYTALGGYIRKVDERMDAELARQFLVHSSNRGRALTLHERDQMSLPPSRGGLGIQRTSETAPAACIAAWASSLTLMRKHFRAQTGACGDGDLEEFTEKTLLSDKLDGVDDPMGVVTAHARLRAHQKWLGDDENQWIVGG